MSEQRERERAFREFGNALVGLGRKLSIGSQLEVIGQRMRKVARAELNDKNLVTLRKPVDDLRALVDSMATTTAELRTILDDIVTVVGVDN